MIISCHASLHSKFGFEGISGILILVYVQDRPPIPDCGVLGVYNNQSDDFVAAVLDITAQCSAW